MIGESVDHQRRRNDSRWARAALVATAAVLVLVACTAGNAAEIDSRAAAVPPAPKPVPMGIYHGAGATGAVARFEQRLGRPLDLAHDYFDRRSWTGITDVSWMAQRWTRAGFADRMVFTVPLIPDRGGSLAQGAAGSYNKYFRTIAKRLVAGGQGKSILRLGPEFNGNWFKWSIVGPRGGARFAAYWRQIVKTMRAVRGARFRFDWAPNSGSAYTHNGRRQLNAASAYPGNKYVDYIGMDMFDQSWAPHSRSPRARWNEFLTQKDGLAWHARFAASKGKPMTFPEWGLAKRADGHGGGDNPYFIEQMFEWIQTHRVAYHLYFESRDPNGEYGVLSGKFPKAAQTFVQNFGSGASASAAALAQRG